MRTSLNSPTTSKHTRKYPYIEDKGLKWDVIKMEIRSFTISYSKRLARMRKDSEKILSTKLNNLMAQSAICQNNPQLKIEIEDTRARLNKITEQKQGG